MRRLSSMGRLILFVGLLSIPAAGVLMLFDRLEQAWIAPVAALSFTLLAGLAPQIFFIRQLDGKSDPILGRGVRVFPEPALCVFVARSIFGKGVVFMSQGLLASLREEEVHEVLKLAETRLNESGVVFQSTCAMLACWIVGVLPKDCTSLFMSSRYSIRRMTGISPERLLRFLVGYSMIRGLLGLAGKSQLADYSRVSFGVAHKFRKSSALWPSSVSPGVFRLRLLSLS